MAFKSIRLFIAYTNDFKGGDVGKGNLRISWIPIDFNCKIIFYNGILLI